MNRFQRDVARRLCNCAYCSSILRFDRRIDKQIFLIIKKFQTIYVSIVLENRIYFSFYSLRNIVINDGETKKLDLKKKKKKKNERFSCIFDNVPMDSSILCARYEQDE